MPSNSEDRRGQVFRLDGLFLRKSSVCVRLAVDESSLDAATSQQRRVALWPVVAALVLVDVRSATELSHPDNERLVEQAALLQIIQQSGERLVGDRQLIARRRFVHPRVVEAVRVPAAIIDARDRQCWMKSNTVTNFTPDSTRRRASRQLWP